MPPRCPAPLQRSVPITVDINFTPHRQWGRHPDRVELIFEDVSLGRRFAITRTIHAIIASEADIKALQPVAPYRPFERKEREAPKKVLDGDKPEALAEIIWKVPLHLYKVPAELERAMQDGDKQHRIRVLQRVFLPHFLRAHTYRRHWGVLLHVEELRTTCVCL